METRDNLIIKAFADDLGCIVENLAATLPIMYTCFVDFPLASALGLSLKKSIIIPVHPENAATVKEIVLDLVPACSEFLLALN